MNPHDNNHHPATVAAHLDGDTIGTLTRHAEADGCTVHDLAGRILSEWAGIERAKATHPSSFRVDDAPLAAHLSVLRIEGARLIDLSHRAS